MIDPKYRSGKICPRCEIPTERIVGLTRIEGRRITLRCPRCGDSVFAHDPVQSQSRWPLGSRPGGMRSGGMGWVAPPHIRELRFHLHRFLEEISTDKRRTYELVRRLLRMSRRTEVHIGWLDESELNRLADALGVRSAEDWRPYLPKAPYGRK